MADLIELDVVVRNKGLKESLTTVERLERQLTNAAKAVEQNRISQDRYNKVLLSAKRQYEALGVSSQKATGQVRRFADAQRQAAKDITLATVAIKGNVQAQMAATKGSNQFGVVTQQAGYQVSDFIVQVQSGTNAFVAFGQQASQLVGVLPLIASPLGLTAGAAVALSAGLGIAIPLVTAIGAAFTRSAKDAKEAADGLKTYEEALDGLSKKADQLRNKRLSLTTEFDEDALIASQKRVELANIIAQKQIDQIGLTGERLELSQNLIDTLEEQLSKESEIVNKAIERVRKEEERLQKAKEAAEWEAGADERKLAFLERRDGFLKYFNAQIEANAKAEEDALAKAEKLEKGRAKATEDRFNALMKSIAANDAANARAEQQQAAANQSAEDQLKILEQQNAVIEYQVVFGKDSREAERLKGQYIVANLRSSLEKKGVDEEIIVALIEQQQLLLSNKQILSDQVEEAKKLKEALTPVTAQYLLDKGVLPPQAAKDFETVNKAEEEFLSDKRAAARKKAEEQAKKYAKALEEQKRAAEKLRKELEAPMVNAIGTVSDAFGDFIARGLTDFKGFVKQILGSFQNMIAQMIAMAVRNRIMLSLGIGGVTPAAAAAGQVAGLGSAGTMLGSIGTGTGFAGIAGGTGFLGGAANTISGLAGGGAGVFNVAGNAAMAGGGAMATIGAAVPLVAAGVALFSLFGGSKPLVSAENMQKFNNALVMTGQEIEATGHEAMVTAKALADVAGGFKELSEKSQAFYENFYTEGERRADGASAATQALNKTFADLELAVPKTHAEFRQLVEAQDLMTDAGRKTYNALLDVSGAFVTLKGTAEQANEAIKLERARELEQRAKKALPLTERFVAQEMINQQIETLGTTAELNEFLLRGLDSYLSIANVPAYARKEQLERVKEQLDGFLEDTTYVQNIQREFYEGLKKPIQEVKNMLKQVGGSKQDMAQYERYGDISGDLMDKLTERFGKYFEYNVLPYTTQLELFIKDQVSRVIGPLVEAIRVTNFRGDLGVINKKIEVSAGRVTSGYAALASGYRKIVEAVDKVEDYYERDFANLRTEYTGAAGLESSTAVKSITDRISGILDLPKRLVGVIENSMRTLARQADKLSGSFVKVQQEYIKLKYSGQEVSEGLEESYRDMLAERQAAGKAAAEAQKRVEQLTLFIRTVEGAVQGFKDSVERVVTSPIEEALAVFLPTELDSLAQDVRTQIKEILGSMGEGTLDTFETGLVTLSDLLASNTITVDQFNNSFKLMQDVFEGNISLTDQYTTKQQSVVEKLSSAYEDFTSKLQNLLGVVRSGIESLIGQATDVNAVANRRGSLAYLRAVASTGQVDASRLESAVGVVTSGDISGFGTRQEFLRYVADTTSLLRTVEGTLSGQLDTLEMQQVKAILNIQDTNETAATSLQNIQALLAEFLGVGGRIPTFATGGYHAGGLRIVGENGPELEATGPSRIIPAGKFSMGGDAELRREVAELRVDLKAALVQIAKNTRKSSDTLNKFDYQGLPNSRGY